MSKFRFELNIEGLRDLMKSDEMVEVLDEAGSAVADGAGLDYGYRTHEGDYTAITNVYPDSNEARRENLYNNSLLKSLGNTLPMTKGD